VCLVNYALLLHCLHFPHSAFYRYVGLGRHFSGSGNTRNDSDHVVWRFDKSASFRTFYSAFYFPHSAFRNSAFYPQPTCPLSRLCIFQAALIWLTSLPRDATQSAVPWQVVCPSVCPSVCDIEVSWSCRLEFMENNFTAEWQGYRLAENSVIPGNSRELLRISGRL